MRITTYIQNVASVDSSWCRIHRETHCLSIQLNMAKSDGKYEVSVFLEDSASMPAFLDSLICELERLKKEASSG